MTDLTDLNVVASAEDWAGFGADGCRSDRSIETGALLSRLQLPHNAMTKLGQDVVHFSHHSPSPSSSPLRTRRA